ncbi:VirD4-like conjugal transfer protein, CD1115 family [Lentilactobacillus hilgardii]|uniref:VirD4-like conjugal transfer protein, CD1115 family n=1 Tax=Lentilactobacillus hilgardii TaxID=1588 RepID=UPI00390C511F
MKSGIEEGYDPNTNRFTKNEYGKRGQKEIVTEDQQRLIYIKTIFKLIFTTYLITLGLLLISYFLTIFQYAQPLINNTRGFVGTNAMLIESFEKVLNHVYSIFYLIPGINVVTGLIAVNTRWINTFLLKILINFLLTGLSVYALAWIVWKARRQIVVLNKSKINKGQLGDSRFSRADELVKQYKIVPDKSMSFEGSGGLPISHIPSDYKPLIKQIKEEGKINLEEAKQQGVKGYYLVSLASSPSNKAVYGTTRSGKGEEFVFSTLDILSRAKQKASIIATDPKVELFRSTAELLRSRGYKVYALNLDRMDYSDGNDPLNLVKKWLLKRNIDEATRELNEVAATIYSNVEGDNAYWARTSRALFTGVSLGIAYHEAKSSKDYRKLTMHNIISTITSLGGITTVVKGNMPIDFRRIDHFFKRIKMESENQRDYMRELGQSSFRWYNISELAGSKQRGMIYSNTVSELGIYLQGNVARLTSKSSFDFRKFAFPRQLYIDGGREIQFAKLTVKILDQKGKALETTRALADLNGQADLDFATQFVVNKPVKLLIQNDEKLTKDDKPIEWTYQLLLKKIGLNKRVLVKPLSEPSELNVKVDYDDRPCALFLITPASRTAYNQISALAINQCYTETTTAAAHFNGGKMYYPIQVIGDEWGNVPAIPDFANKLSQGLGIGFTFNIFLQSKEQLDKRYGKEVAKILLDNINTKVYLSSSESETRKWFSEALGNKTIVVGGKNAGMKSLNKIGSQEGVQQQESLRQRPLLDEDELKLLYPGETVVTRTGDRLDKEKRPVDQYPIFNTGKLSLPQRHKFLDYIDTSKNMLDQNISSEIRKIDLRKLEIDFSDMKLDELVDESENLDNAAKKGYGDKTAADPEQSDDSEEYY